MRKCVHARCARLENVNVSLFKPELNIPCTIMSQDYIMKVQRGVGHDDSWQVSLAVFCVQYICAYMYDRPHVIRIPGCRFMVPRDLARLIS